MIDLPWCHNVLQIMCPKCSAKLGQFNWSGHECSSIGCGMFITPWLHIQKGRVDTVRIDAASPAAKTLLQRFANDV